MKNFIRAWFGIRKRKRQKKQKHFNTQLKLKLSSSVIYWFPYHLYVVQHNIGTRITHKKQNMEMIQQPRKRACSQLPIQYFFHFNGIETTVSPLRHCSFFCFLSFTMNDIHVICWQHYRCTILFDYSLEMLENIERETDVDVVLLRQFEL